MPKIGVHDQRRIRQRIDLLVAFHRLPAPEPDCGIEGGDQHQTPVHEWLAIPAVERGAFEVIAQDANRMPTRRQGSPHGRLIDATGPTGDNLHLRFGGQMSNAFRVLNKFLVHLS